MTKNWLMADEHKSCEDAEVTYYQVDNVRFIYKYGDYVGWYAC